MFIKVHKSYRDVVAIADEDLIGKKFEEENFVLDLKESFYKGESVKKEQLKKEIESLKREDATFNIVGENSISIALECNIIDKNSVGTIKGIPYALVLL